MRNFLPTCISQRVCFSLLGRAIESLRATVLLALLAEASLIASAGGAATGSPGLATAIVTAVVLSAIVAPADEECHEAPQARRLVDESARVQGSGAPARKLGCGPEPWDQYLCRTPGSGPTAEGSSCRLGPSLLSVRPDHPVAATRGPVLDTWSPGPR